MQNFGSWYKTGCPRFLSTLAAFELYPGLRREHTVLVSRLYSRLKKKKRDILKGS